MGICQSFLKSLLCCGLVLAVPAARAQYHVHYQAEDKDSLFVSKLGLPASFANRIACAAYLAGLPGVLKGKGYVTASVDSVALDTAGAQVFMYVGEAYRWAAIRIREQDKSLLQRIGWNEKIFGNKPLDFAQLQNWQNRVMDYLENNGYAFAKIELDSITIAGDKVDARMVVDKGPLYKIDSIRVFGEVKVSDYFLRRYLGIDNGSIYKKEKLQQVRKKLLELPYLQERQPWDLTMLGTGSILNLYLAPRRSSQVNVLIGLLPNNQALPGEPTKLLLTGEALVNLRNALGMGEFIGANWQRLQSSTQRLNLAYQQPYLFNSPLGMDFSFELFKKDSSFVNINFQLGAQYFITGNHSAKVYWQVQSSNVSLADTNFVKANKRLPDNIDVRSNSVGADYELYATDYRFNPRRGNELKLGLAVGTKKIKRNNDILQLKDPLNPSYNFASLYDTLRANGYQLRAKLSVAHHVPLGRQGTVRVALNGGMFLSPNIFRNELFQIGGFRSLRGFDEESVLASQYGVGTVEYRYLTGLNAYFFLFGDYGWVRNNSQNAVVKSGQSYIGTGLGMAFETKAGLFNISYAVGKRPADAGLNFRQSKIHIGYVNYF
jgi:outer membrane protein assembly factor BamA